MADVLTPEQRHKNMSNIKGKDTSIELKLRKALFARGFRFRKNVASMPGKPDIVLKKYKTVIFVHGCFWHQHEGCKYSTIPSTRTEFWVNKFQKTKERDIREQQELIKDGWNVIVVWECELRKDEFDKTLEKVIMNLENNRKMIAH